MQWFILLVICILVGWNILLTRRLRNLRHEKDVAIDLIIQTLLENVPDLSSRTEVDLKRQKRVL